MINKKKRIIQDSIIYLNLLNNDNMARKTGQFRRAKIRASCFIKGMNNKDVLTPTLRELLEARLALQTTNTKILATKLRRSPATIGTQLQQIHTILGVKPSFSIMRVT
jgi:hypothetical protein